MFQFIGYTLIAFGTTHPFLQQQLWVGIETTSLAVFPSILESPQLLEFGLVGLG